MIDDETQGPGVQSVVSLTNTSVVKILTALVSTISNSRVFLLKKCEATHIFSAKLIAYMSYLMIKVLTIRLLTTSFVLNNWVLADAQHYKKKRMRFPWVQNLSFYSKKGLGAQ